MYNIIYNSCTYINDTDIHIVRLNEEKYKTLTYKIIESCFIQEARNEKCHNSGISRIIFCTNSKKSKPGFVETDFYTMHKIFGGFNRYICCLHQPLIKMIN